MSESSPKILVTGAAGNLGRFVLAELARERFDVRASDCVEDSDAVFPIHVTHLLDLPSVRKLMQGIDIVIHLANHAYQRDNEITFNENVAMNMNVFQAAADLGARKILFASSVQVIGSEGGDAPIDRHPRFPSLPLNEETPPFPTNSYALSKLAGEVQLRYFATCHKLEGIAIRFPGMHPNERHLSKPDWVPPARLHPPGFLQSDLRGCRPPVGRHHSNAATRLPGLLPEFSREPGQPAHLSSPEGILPRNPLPANPVRRGSPRRHQYHHPRNRLDSPGPAPHLKVGSSRAGHGNGVPWLHLPQTPSL